MRGWRFRGLPCLCPAAASISKFLRTPRLSPASNSSIPRFAEFWRKQPSADYSCGLQFHPPGRMTSSLPCADMSSARTGACPHYAAYPWRNQKTLRPRRTNLISVRRFRKNRPATSDSKQLFFAFSFSNAGVDLQPFPHNRQWRFHFVTLTSQRNQRAQPSIAQEEP